MINIFLFWKTSITPQWTALLNCSERGNQYVAIFGIHKENFIKRFEIKNKILEYKLKFQELCSTHPDIKNFIKEQNEAISSNKFFTRIKKKWLWYLT